MHVQIIASLTDALRPKYRRGQCSIALKLQSLPRTSLSFGSIRPYAESNQSSGELTEINMKHTSKTAALAFGVAVLFGSVAVGLAQTDSTSSNTTSETTTSAPAPAVVYAAPVVVAPPPPIVVAAPAVVEAPSTTATEHHSSSSSDSSPSGDSSEHSSSTSTSNY
jgi:hypothetical protein